MSRGKLLLEDVSRIATLPPETQDWILNLLER